VRTKGEPIKDVEALDDREKSEEPEKEYTVGDDVDNGRLPRALSTPPPGEAVARVKDPRPLSTGSFIEGESGSLTGSGSERSIGETPQHRRIKETMSNSPRVRPRVSLIHRIVLLMTTVA